MLKILEKSKLSEENIYNSIVKESYKIFSKFSDDDFFSDKVEHIYFYSVISDDSVIQLQIILQEASKTVLDNTTCTYTSPKPICIHLDSTGGTVSSTDTFYTIIQTIRIPFCIIIENLCASAATILALLAPYRVMIDYSSYLIHDSFSPDIGKTHDMIKRKIPHLYTLLYYTKLLQKRTKLSKDEIYNFYERDILIDSKYCLQKNIIDRLLKFPKINNPSFYTNSSNLQLNLSTFMKKTNLNHIYIDENIDISNNLIGTKINYDIQNTRNKNELTVLFDNLFLVKKNNTKPIVLHFKSQELFVSSPLDFIKLNYRISMIQKRLPIIAFVEGNLQLDLLPTLLSCPIRIMMKPSILQSNFSSDLLSLSDFSKKTIDIIDNSIFIFNNTVKLLKSFSKLPNKYYKDMRNKIININEKDMLKYNIIHLCLDMHKLDISSFTIEKYFELNEVKHPQHQKKPRLNRSKSI